MSDILKYIESLFLQSNLKIASNRVMLFNAFVNEQENIDMVRQIQENQKKMMERWTLKNKINDIIDKHFPIPNGTVGKPYNVVINVSELGNKQISFTEFEGLEQYGLKYDNEAERIDGIPLQSGDFKIKLKFRVTGEPNDSDLNIKTLSLIINADPKSLWKTVASDENKDEKWKEENYWKADDVTVFESLGDKHIVVASQRGRSHANVGSFRDDDFGFTFLEETGWSVVCVADGAGSAALSRKGSSLACTAVIEYFSQNFSKVSLNEFDNVLLSHSSNATEETSKQISYFVYNNLSKAAMSAHKKIEEFANKAERPIKDFHSTLIFALLKKYPFGYAILTFGVGDCPIGLLNKDISEIKLMNWLDVGEFGGGTRFITMPEIFSSDKFPTRFGFKLVDDFSYLMLMTDGIYDPKFVVEANLEKIDKWKEFLEDLNGNNEEKVVVEFNSPKEVADELLAWMQFWSAGNHDDRTLAIVF